MLENKNRIVIFIILLFISSCQKVEILDPIVFDNDQFTKISINAEKKNTIILYEPKFVEPFIDHSLENLHPLRKYRAFTGLDNPVRPPTELQNDSLENDCNGISLRGLLSAVGRLQ